MGSRGLVAGKRQWNKRKITGALFAIGRLNVAEMMKPVKSTASRSLKRRLPRRRCASVRRFLSVSRHGFADSPRIN